MKNSKNKYTFAFPYKIAKKFFAMLSKTNQIVDNLDAEKKDKRE